MKNALWKRSIYREHTTRRGGGGGKEQRGQNGVEEMVRNQKRVTHRVHPLGRCLHRCVRANRTPPETYSNGNHQRHILRIIFLVPIYALLSFAALMRPKHSLDLDTFRDCYESWVVYNFLALCFEYVGGPGNVQNNMQGKELPPSVWACARESQQVDGAYLRRSKQYALQFVFLKPFLSLISWIMHMRGQYGDSAIDFKRGYVYVLFVYNISYSFALYGLLMFYRGAYDLLKPHKPLAKLYVGESGHLSDRFGKERLSR